MKVQLEGVVQSYKYTNPELFEVPGAPIATKPCQFAME
jgi:hypothetical protein